MVEYVTDYKKPLVPYVRELMVFFFVINYRLYLVGVFQKPDILVEKDLTKESSNNKYISRMS
ncbi:MAG: hypothetical protein ACLFPF_05025 [Halanaerobiales bacterium]